MKTTSEIIEELNNENKPEFGVQLEPNKCLFCIDGKNSYDIRALDILREYFKKNGVLYCDHSNRLLNHTDKLFEILSESALLCDKRTEDETVLYNYERMKELFSRYKKRIQSFYEPNLYENQFTPEEIEKFERISNSLTEHLRNNDNIAEWHDKDLIEDYHILSRYNSWSDLNNLDGDIEFLLEIIEANRIS